jgi:TonB family protein
LSPEVSRRLAEIDPSLVEWVRASTEAGSRALGPGSEDLPGEGSGGGASGNERQTAEAYFVRLFLGSRFDPIPESSQGLMGDGLEVVPLRESEVWGDSEQERYLAETFRLASMVAVDGARLVSDPEDGEADSSFVVGVAGHLFKVVVHASPAEDPGMHRIELRVQRADTRAGETGDGTTILETTLMVENGRIVVLGIPEADAAASGGRGPRVAFVALSPRFAQFARPADGEPVYAVDGDVDPPVVVEKTEPEYPREARERGAEGRVVLQAVIRADGSVDGVQVLRVPQVSGGEFLVEAAARAVRQWRYLPAQLHGDPVNAYFTVVVHFQLSRDGDL